MRGRYPVGPEYVDQLEGSAEAKQRAKVILQTLHGHLRVQEACRLLGICEQRFHQLREEMLQAAVARLEAKPTGRPRRAAEPADVQELKEQLAAKQLELRVAHLREEIALAMPHLTVRPDQPDEREKKNDWPEQTTSPLGLVEEVTAAANAAVPVFYAEISAMESTVAEPDPAAANQTDVASLLECSRMKCGRDDHDHLDRVQRLVQAEIEAATKPRRRGSAWQQSKRQLQQEIRRHTVACYRQLGERGYSVDDVAELLQLTPRTLRHWDYASRHDKIAVVPLGRPTARSPVHSRQEVLGFLKDQGPGVGVPALQQRFPDLARAELTDLLGRYRQVWTARHQDCLRLVHWPVVGRVWSMDFAEPSRRGQGGVLPPLEGRYPYLLAVRDLASGYQLCWLPVTAATSAITCAVLERLFAEHGLPLVLKADNGPPFRAYQTKRFLEQAGVHFLFSPPYWPRYNGGIEAAIGSLKTRTEQHAAEHGRAGHWTCADVEAARRQANASQPRRLYGQTPAEAWAGRTRVTDLERVRLELTTARQRYPACSELGLEPGTDLDHWQGSALDRKAIERALVEHDYLLFRGRRVPLTVTPGKVTV